MSDLELRPAHAHDFEDVARLLTLTFGEGLTDDDLARGQVWWEPKRSLIAWLGGERVATSWVVPTAVEVPGGVRPAAGVTGVGVSPVHRRRGILTALMTRQLRDVYEAGDEAFAVLWASEATIYGRFGYGSAAPHVRLELPRARGAFRRPPDPEVTLRLAPPDVELLLPVYDAARAGRPGMIARDGRFWSARLSDLQSQRGAASAYLAVLAGGPAGTEGYAVYRTRSSWDGRARRGDVEVLEVVTVTPRAHAALWGYLVGLDLMTDVTCRIPLDDPLPLLLVDARAAGLTVGDGPWVRLVDLPRALSERSYAAPVSVTLQVVDDTCPWNAGRWLLEAGPDGASCTRTDRPADLTLDVSALGAVFLGGPRLLTLGAAGQVDESTPGALVAASRAFAGDVAPFCSEVF